MKLVICICTYNRNFGLIRCLKSINNLCGVSNIKIKIVVVDNSEKYTSLKLIKKLKKTFLNLAQSCCISQISSKNFYRTNTIGNACNGLCFSKLK